MAHETLKKDENLWTGIDLIVPVPLHKKRRRERGFNQAEEISRVIGKRAESRSRPTPLKKIRHTPPQTSLERHERAENVRGAYIVGRKSTVEGKIMLLVDDVFTTGSTLGECARVLREEGRPKSGALPSPKRSLLYS